MTESKSSASTSAPKDDKEIKLLQDKLMEYLYTLKLTEKKHMWYAVKRCRELVENSLGIHSQPTDSVSAVAEAKTIERIENFTYAEWLRTSRLSPIASRIPPHKLAVGVAFQVLERSMHFVSFPNIQAALAKVAGSWGASTDCIFVKEYMEKPSVLTHIKRKRVEGGEKEAKVKVKSAFTKWENTSLPRSFHSTKKPTTALQNFPRFFSAVIVPPIVIPQPQAATGSVKINPSKP